MKTKRNLTMQVKELSNEGSFEGLLSVYNSVDLGGDTIVPGAFKKTIQEHGSEIPMLWQHKADVPIGTLKLSDGPDALSVQGQLLMEIPEAKTAYLLMKAGIVKGLSIGYTTVKDSVENGVRVLKECRLWEGSVVTFPMQSLALISSIKNHRHSTKDDFTEELDDQCLQDMGNQMRSALFSALSSVVMASDMTKEERVTAAGIILQQFSAAYLEYLPKYLDWLTEEYGDDFMTMGAKPHEIKTGRMISEMNQNTISSALGKMRNGMDQHKSAIDDLQALIDDGADYCDSESGDCGTTSKSKAANKQKALPEPVVVDHSATVNLLNQLQAALATR